MVNYHAVQQSQNGVDLSVYSVSWRVATCGHHALMAPEMLEPPVEGETAPDGYGDKADVYSFGIVLWELFGWRSLDGREACFKEGNH